MKAIVTDLQGARNEIALDPELTLMENIKDSGVSILAMCGGGCACSTCHVYVDPEWLAKLPPRGADEEDTLDQVGDLRPNSRLSCQIRLKPELDGLSVTLSEDTRE